MDKNVIEQINIETNPPQRSKKRKVARTLVIAIIIAVILFLSALVAVLMPSSMICTQTRDDIIYFVTGKDIQDGQVKLNADTIKKASDFDADAILILGCGLKNPDTPSDMLRDRLMTGVALWQAGVCETILLTGDSMSVTHDEVGVMKSWCIAAGVPEEALLLDEMGISTGKSIKNAIELFGLERVLIVTQAYHEYRALYIAKELGLAAAGVASDPERYILQSYRDLREIFARDKDFARLQGWI